MTSVNHLCTQLRAQGRRVTPQRRAIIQVLLEDDGTHPTAERICAHVQGSMPDMSRATVYNTLRELTEINVLLELDLGLGERRYDLNTTDHAHLVCLGCGRVVDVEFDHESPSLSPEQARGFQVVSRDVIFRGYCPACVSGA